MSEERPRRHPEEPAEGGEEDVEAPGTERARGEEAPGGDAPEEAPSLSTPRSPPRAAGEEDVEAPGAERAGEGQNT